MEKDFNIIEYLITEKKLKGEAIAERLDVSAAFISNLKRGKPIGLDVAKKISAAFDLPLDFVISGTNGNILREPEGAIYVGGKHQKSKKPNPRIEADPVKLAINPLDVEGDRSKFFELPDGSLVMQVPVIPYKAFAGYLHGFQDQEYYEDLDTVMVGVEKRHAGDYLAFEVKGDSMVTYDPILNHKSIHPGRLAIGRFLPKHQWRSKLHIGNNDAWVIVHKTEGILIKNICKHDVERGIITIHSLNDNKEIYPDEDLHLDDIEQIFDVLQVVDKRR